MQTTVIYHSADYDGIFCQKIAQKFLPETNTNYIGWDFSDAPLTPPLFGDIYILDLPVNQVFGIKDIESNQSLLSRIIWIDHHKSAILSHPVSLKGYRIDGVAACRLTWQWFNTANLPEKQSFINRMVNEPLSVRLAGEYDVWDHRKDGDEEFQFGLDCLAPEYIDTMLSFDSVATLTVNHAITLGKAAMACYAKRDADIVNKRSFIKNWENLNFLTLNTAKCNSQTFKVKDVPETGHDAIMAFNYDGKEWNFSLYHAAHKTDIDLSIIAAKYGGGGHKGACGFRLKVLPFSNESH